MTGNEAVGAGDEDKGSLWENEVGRSHYGCCVLHVLDIRERKRVYVVLNAGLSDLLSSSCRLPYVGCRAFMLSNPLAVQVKA